MWVSKEPQLFHQSMGLWTCYTDTMHKGTHCPSYSMTTLLLSLLSHQATTRAPHKTACQGCACFFLVRMTIKILRLCQKDRVLDGPPSSTSTLTNATYERIVQMHSCQHFVASASNILGISRKGMPLLNLLRDKTPSCKHQPT